MRPGLFLSRRSGMLGMLTEASTSLVSMSITTAAPFKGWPIRSFRLSLLMCQGWTSMRPVAGDMMACILPCRRMSTVSLTSSPDWGAKSGLGVRVVQAPGLSV